MLPGFALECYWLDCNVYVQAENGPYNCRIAPTFWSWLHGKIRDGQVRSPVSVYRELMQGHDHLSLWIRTMKKDGLFVKPSRSVYTHFTGIADYVSAHYEQHHAAEFLKGADPWVIAHALDNSGTVVTHEALVPSGSHRVKIPNICAQFDVRCLGAYAEFEKLDLRL